MERKARTVKAEAASPQCPLQPRQDGVLTLSLCCQMITPVWGVITPHTVLTPELGSVRISTCCLGSTVMSFRLLKTRVMHYM